MIDFIKKIAKKITGIEKIEKSIQDLHQKEREAVEKMAESQREAERARQEAEEAKLTPKERATKKGEPWVAVLETHVNKENLRNGFFELDWNEHFVVQLKQQGYGFEGDPDEEIVDRWFRALCNDIAGDEGINMDRRGAGYINVQQIAGGKSEVS
jgi:hypothetical protein